MSSSPTMTRTLSWPSSLNQLSPLAPSTTSPAKQSSSAIYDDDSDMEDETYDTYLSHFAAPVTEEDDPDEFLSMSAGIKPFASSSTPSLRSSSRSPSPSNMPKGASFRDRVAKRWDKYVVHHQPHHIPPAPATAQITPPAWNFPLHADYNQENADLYQDCTEEEQVEMARTALTAVRVPVIVIEPTRGHAQQILLGNRELKKRRPSLSRKSHSWKEPPANLFTVLEGEEEREESGKESEGDERPPLRKKHDSGFLEGRWEDEMEGERPLLKWD